MKDFFSDLWATTKENSQFYFGKVEGKTPGGRLSLGILALTILVSAVAIKFGTSILPELFMSTAIIGLYWPQWVLSMIIKEPTWRSTWPVRGFCFCMLSYALQSLDIFLTAFIMVIALSVVIALTLMAFGKRQLGQWILVKGILVFLLLIYGIPGVLMLGYGPQEFHVRAVIRNERYDTYLIHTDRGADEFSEGETFRFDDMPLWGSYGSDDRIGLLTQAADKGYKVRAWVTYFRFQPWHLHCNIYDFTVKWEKPEGKPPSD